MAFKDNSEKLQIFTVGNIIYVCAFQRVHMMGISVACEIAVLERKLYWKESREGKKPDSF